VPRVPLLACGVESFEANLEQLRQQLGRRRHHLYRLSTRHLRSPMRIVAPRCGDLEAIDLRATLLGPLGVQARLTAAHRAVGVAVAGVEVEGGFKQGCRLPRAIGIAAGNGLQLRIGSPERGHGGGDQCGIAGIQRHRARQHGHVLGRDRDCASAHYFVYRIQSPVLRRQGIQTRRCAVVGLLSDQRLQLLDELLARRIGNVERLLPGETTIRQRRLRVDQILEAQHQRQRVVEFRGTFVQNGAQLVVGEERAIRLERGGPPQRLQRGLGPPFYLGDRLLRLKASLRVPRTSDGRLPAALQIQLRFNRRGLHLVQVAPAFFPDLRAIHPALAIAGEQHFQRLGEAGLPRPVAPDDDGEARARSPILRR